MVHARYERHWATRRVRWFRLAAFLLGGSSLGSAPAAAQIAVDQAEIFLEPRTAGRGVASINVSNEGDTVIEASVYVSDWERRDDGEHRFYQSGTLRQSCGGVVRVPGRTPADTGRELALAFRNSGGMPLWVHGKVEFRRLNNAVAATADVPEFPVLPGALRRVAVALPALARGRYVALALLDYGGSDIAGAQVVVEVP